MCHFFILSCYYLLIIIKIANNIWQPLACIIKSLTSEATPSATPYFKMAYKISHPPQLKVSWVDLPSFATSSKIWPNFSKKVVKKLIL